MDEIPLNVSPTFLPPRLTLRRSQTLFKGLHYISCFYCNKEEAFERHKLVFEQERGFWTCSHCGSHNLFKESSNNHLLHQFNASMNVGGFVRQQQHHQQNEQLLRHPEFSLCRICTHNQDLVVKLLAAYDPADDEFFHESVDDYKQSLETQYPPLCAQCQSRVDLKLRDVTHRVKSQILHAALQKSRKSRGLLDTHYSSVVGLGFLVYSLVWILVISTLVVSIAATLIMHFFGLAFPISFNILHCTSPLSSSSVSASPSLYLNLISEYACFLFTRLPQLCILGSIALPFNPIWIFKILYPTVVSLRSKQDYIIGQVKLLILRSIASYIVLTETNPQQLLINHFILLLLNLHVLAQLFSLIKISQTRITKPSSSSSTSLSSRKHTTVQSGVQSGGQNHCLSGDDYRRRKAWKWDDETKKCDPPNSPQVDDLMQSLGIESALAGSKLKDEDSCSVFVSRKRIYFRIGLAASLLSCVAGILTFFIPLGYGFLTRVRDCSLFTALVGLTITTWYVQSMKVLWKTRLTFLKYAIGYLFGRLIVSLVVVGGPLSDEFQSQFLDAMNVLEIWDVVGLAGAGSFFSALDAGMIIFAGTNWQLLS